jgi:hypothetical protein
MTGAEPATSTPPTLQAALLDYFDAPGRYQLSLRQPALLFASVREILQMAAGRGAAAGAGRLREAAMFFIRAALLYPGADHYAVLGFAPGADVPDLKERYRLLMRLIHPDYAAAGAAAWPTDAAVRVNRAYEVLSAPVLRRDYDEQLAAQRAPTPVRPSFQAAAARRPAPARLRMGRRGIGFADQKRPKGCIVGLGAAEIACLKGIEHRFVLRMKSFWFLNRMRVDPASRHSAIQRAESGSR